METDRRFFLKAAATVAAAVAALLAGIPALRAFVSPVFGRRRPQTWVRLGEAALFDIETPVKVDFVETVSDAWIESRVLRSVWVYTEDGEHFTAYNARCTHLGCSFGFDKEQKMFRCPCHMGAFDLKTGAVLTGPPPRSLDKLEVKIERGVLYAAYQNFRLGVPGKIAVS